MDPNILKEIYETRGKRKMAKQMPPWMQKAQEAKQGRGKKVIAPSPRIAALQKRKAKLVKTPGNATPGDGIHTQKA